MMLTVLRAILIACVMLGSAGGFAVAEPSDDAVSAYKSGDYKKAFALLKPLADHGNAMAQTYLGDMCFYGQGRPQSYPDALSWYRSAAEQDNAAALNSLGFMYQMGQGTPQDTAAAIAWYRRAADLGYSVAQNNLAIIYSSGQGVPRDYVQAHKWFNLTATGQADSERRTRTLQALTVISASMTPGEIAEAQWLAREWRPKPSKQAP